MWRGRRGAVAGRHPQGDVTRCALARHTTSVREPALLPAHLPGGLAILGEVDKDAELPRVLGSHSRRRRLDAGHRDQGLETGHKTAG